MRISYLFNSSIPSNNASSLQVIKTCEGLIKNNHEVFLITPDTGLNLDIMKFYDLIFLPKRIKLKFFKSFPIGFKYYLFSILSVLKALSLRSDIFITRNLFTLFILNLFKKKIIVEFHHDLENEGRIVKFIFNNFKVLRSKNIIKIVAITKPVREYLINTLGVDKKKIEIIPSASSLNIKYTNLKKKKNFNIGYFGSFEKSKGVNFIISLSKIDKVNKYFVYGGDKKKVNELKKNFKGNNLKINEYISYKDLKYEINKMDILLMPSNKKELKSLGGVGNIAKFTSPLKLFDYLASGKLIIISNLDVFKEIVKKNQHCVVIDNLNLQRWYQEIKNINKNLYKINMIKKNAYKLSKKFTYTNRARLLLKNINI